MKQIYTGKVESATFSNPPENSIIEFLWRDDKQLVANEIAINFADPEFLAFIKEYPLEKIEKAAKAVAGAAQTGVKQRQTVMGSVNSDCRKKQCLQRKPRL